MNMSFRGTATWKPLFDGGSVTIVAETPSSSPSQFYMAVRAADYFESGVTKTDGSLFQAQRGYRYLAAATAASPSLPLSCCLSNQQTRDPPGGPSPSPSTALRVEFVDGSLFLQLQLEAVPIACDSSSLWRCTAYDRHHCGDDLYDATFEITLRGRPLQDTAKTTSREDVASCLTSPLTSTGDPPLLAADCLEVEDVLSMRISYHVMGPEKAYTSITNYSPTLD